MARVRLEIHGALAARLAPRGEPGPARLDVDVAPGDTLGRMLERLTYEHPPLGTVYLAGQRRLADAVLVTINGQAYHLLGGLTYLLHDLDTVAVYPDAARHDGSQ